MRNNIKFFAILLVILCCFMGAASAVDDVSTDIVDSSVDDAVTVDAIPEDTYDSLSEINSVTNDSDIELNDGKENIGNTRTVTATASDWDGLYNNVINGESEILLTGTEYAIDSNKNIVFHNDVIITGNSNSYVTGGSLSYTPFICSDPSLSITLRNIKFTNITSQILIQLAGTTNIENCSFENIQTAPEGRYSVIYNTNGFMKIVGCNFTNCNAPYGAVTNYHSTPTNVRMNVSNCKFENNTASSDPGAINNCGYLNVTNSTFIFNHANLWAGAIHTHINAYTRILASNFTGNTAGWNGGALFSYGKLEVYNSTFDNNNCTTNNGGGAIGGFPYWGSTYNITVENCNFTNNNNLCGEFTNESTTSLGRGGAISALNGGTLNVHGSRFVHNAAVIGQAICGYNTIYDNATGGEPYLQIYNNTFINHTVTTNDTVYISNGNYTFENNTFINSPQTHYNENNNYDATESNNFADLNSKNRLGKSILSDEETPNNVWYVDPTATGSNDGSSWENAFTNLNNALSKVENDGIIYVANGVYTRRGFSRPINITLIGQGENTIFNNFESSAYGSNTLNLDAGYTFINFTFKQTDVGRNTLFINCTFHDSLQLSVMKYLYTYIYVYETLEERRWVDDGYAFTYNATFDNCVFKNLNSEDAPITVYKYGKAEFNNCTFENITSDSIIYKYGEFVLEDGIYLNDCTFSNINVNGIVDIPGDIDVEDYCAIENCDYDFDATTDIVTTDEYTHNYINATLLKVTITDTSLYAYPEDSEIILSEDDIEDINIELTADDESIDGAVDVYIGEELYDTYDIIGNDIISIPYSAFSTGVNNVTIRYNGDEEENYGPSEYSFTIVAYGEPAYIEINSPDMVVGNNASISFSIVDDDYEKIDAIGLFVEVWSVEYDEDLDEFVDSELLYEESVNSNDLISLDLPVGVYRIIAVSDYDDGYTYYVSGSIEIFNVYDKFTYISIFPADDDETTLDNFEFAIQLYDMVNNPISANLTIIVDGDEENPITFETIVFDPENEDEGPAVLDLGQLSYGEHIIEVYYAGDEESGWVESHESLEFIVLYPSFLNVETSDVFIGDAAAVVIELTGPNGEAIKGNVSIYVESNAQSLFDEYVEIDGSYEFTLESLSEDCIIFAEFYGSQFEDEEFDSDNSYYAPIRSNGFIRVLEVPANLELTISEDGTAVVATLTDGEGNAIADASISISANGVESNLTTDADGKASLPVSGNTTAVASYVDENNITVSSSLNIIVLVNETIKEINNTVVVNNTEYVNVTVYVKPNASISLSTEDGSSVIATLTDGEGNAIADASISISANGVESNLTTDADGKASLPVSGNTTAVASYVDENNITVSSSLNIIVISNEIIKEVNNTIVVNNTIEVPVVVNNTVEVPIVRNASQIEYSDMNTVAVAAADGRIGEYFIITLKDAEGKILADKAVQIGFNGKIYNRTTDENGSAKLQINLAREDIYTFAVSFLGDDYYNGSFVVAKINVTKQSPKLTTANKSYKASAKTKTLTATFKTANGNAVKGKKISFTVNGKTYTGTTNANGIASVKVSISKKGTYSFTAKYAGDDTFATVSKSGKLTIK